MSVDDILASGRYVDRRGRVWEYCEVTDTWSEIRIDAVFGPEIDGPTIGMSAMHTLITRDLHRTECPGLRKCGDHPVPHVIALGWAFAAYTGSPWELIDNHDTLPEALDAAVLMAKEGR
ncbi:hypothetical protein [Sediminivirga luteola]|uniref:hypothetical protein n=1 Tax=Sediminivirga luteola TaxID=1774748 RepID=UPI001663D964|nr:hypothetical protein [Sediminivirga luteola]